MTMRDMLNRVQPGPLSGPRPEDYAPRVMREMEIALVKDQPMPNSSDEIVKSFLDMSEYIAKEMEKMGDKCLAQGETRKAEWYNAANVARKKGQWQAREAGEYIDDLAKFKAISDKHKGEIKPTPEPIPEPPIETTTSQP